MDHKYDKIKEALQPERAGEHDKEALWLAIEQELNNSKKKRRPILLFFILFGAALAVFIYTGIQSRDSEQKSNQSSIAKDFHSLPTHSIDTITTEKTMSVMEKKSVIMSRPEALKNEVNTQPIQNNIKVEQNNKRSEWKHDQTTLSITKAVENTISIKTTALKLKQVDPKDKSVKNDANIFMAKPLENVAETFKSETDVTIQNANAIKSEEILSLKPLILKEVKDVGSLHTADFEMKNLFIPYITSKPAQVKKWQLDVSSGIHLWTKESSTDDVDYTAISTRRKKMATPKESFTAVIMLKRQVISNLYLGAGLQYNQLTEIINAEDITITSREITSDSALYYQGQNSIEYFSGTLTQTQRKGYVIFSPNQLKRWNVPLEISYHHRNGKLQWTPSISMIYTFSQQYKGIHLGPDGKFIYKDKLAFKNLYKTSGLFSLAFGMEVGFHLNRKMYIKLGVVHQRDNNSALQNTSPLKEKYTQTGLRLGLLYAL